MVTVYHCLAIDIGSSNAKAIVLSYDNDAVRVKETEVYRFAHEAIRDEDGDLIWDLDKISTGVKDAFDAALAAFPTLHCASIDCWGVDFVLLDDNDDVIGKPWAYRNERPQRYAERIYEYVSPSKLWEHTGVYPLEINTSMQLASLVHTERHLLAKASCFLFLSDYLLLQLGATRGWNRATASTAGLCEPGSYHWDYGLFDALGIPRHLCGPISAQPEVVGTYKGVSLVRAGGHDTACAVNALPMAADGRSVFISSGSWSIVGIATPKPIVTKSAFEAGLSNEALVGTGNRIVKNLTGLWIVQECQRYWALHGIDVPNRLLSEKSLQASSCGYVFDPQEDSFAEPGDMPRKVADAMAEHVCIDPLDVSTVLRVIDESLAVAHAEAVTELTRVFSHQGSSGGELMIYLIGGGAKSKSLCQFCADAIGQPLRATSIEASAWGNALGSLNAVGVMDDDTRYKTLTRSVEYTIYTPDPTSHLSRLVRERRNNE